MSRFKMYIIRTLQVKESKERAMSTLSPYRSTVSHDYTHDSSSNYQQVTECGPLPFVSLLEFVSEVYQVSWQQTILKCKVC